MTHRACPCRRVCLSIALIVGALAGPGVAQQPPESTFRQVRAAATYLLAQSFRTRGMRELARPETRAAAGKHFEQALAGFERASSLFRARAGEPGDQALPAAWEDYARVRCDVAEMQLRLGRVKEARASAEPFIKDPVLSRSRHRDYGRYLFAHAAFAAGDLPAAQKVLTTLAPFADREYGPHARYLLARTH